VWAIADIGSPPRSSKFVDVSVPTTGDVAAVTHGWVAAQELSFTAAEREPLHRAFTAVLENWIAAMLPPDRFAGRWYDGLVVESQQIPSRGQVLVSGWIWAIERQDRFRFEVELGLGPTDLMRWEVRFGDASTVNGSSNDAGGRPLTFGTPRDWLYRFTP
jgi:hypothetical protein